MGEKSADRLWLTEPPAERELTEPEWWGITLGSTLYGVKALTADEAVDKAQSAFADRFGSGFPIFFAELHSEDIQPEFNVRYPDRDIVRLIPFSAVEYPEDPNQMTPEQTEAFEKLRRP